VARARDARDARVATALFAVAIGGVLAVAGLENVGLLMGAVALLYGVAAGRAQVRLWRLRMRLEEASSPAG
jgi:hypothetical protein